MRRGCKHRRVSSSAPLRDYIDERGLTALDHCNSSLQRRAEILRVRYGTFTIDTHAGGQLGEIDVRVGNGVADMGASYTPLALGGHRLHVHDFLVIGTIV